jgi:carboxyl-terminal processing protease
LFEAVLTTVASRFYAADDTTDLYERAARGLVRQLGDPYSELLTPKDLEGFAQNTLGRYGGVGMLLLPIGDTVFVERVYPNTPGAAAGFKTGDRVVRVGDTPTAGLPIEKVTEMLRGAPGSPVAVTVERRGLGKPIAARLQRAVVRLPVVPYTLMLDGHVAYIPLTGFSETAGAETERALTEAVAAGAHGIILDLRGNGGGSVEEALRVSNAFLAPGVPVLRIVERTQSTLLATTDSPIVASLPLAVLQDGGTASASEIVTGALQDRDRALVVGTTSFGKGLAQSLYPLTGGYALKLTTAKWYTPSGRSIHKNRTAADSARYWEEGDTVVDSLETHVVTRSRPQYRSSGGRVLYGGGGITPDVIIPADTLTTPEQALARSLTDPPGQAGTVLSGYALELSRTVRPGFTVLPAWRDELFRRLMRAGVRVERPAYDAGARYVSWLLEQRVAQLAFGEADAKRRDVALDSQLEAAYDLVRHAGTQSALFQEAATRHAKQPG